MQERQRGEEGESDREGSDTGFVDEEGTTWELDPNDPSHPDYDLSEAAGYGGWEPAEGSRTVWRQVVVVVSLLLVMALILPPLIRLLFF